MRRKALIVRAAVVAAAGIALGWPIWAAVAWARYGRGERVRDPLLDRYLPAYDVAERHETRVAGPASLTYAVAMDMELERLSLARAVIRWRERLLRVRGDGSWPPGGIVAQLQAWGWGVLSEVPGREVVLGAVTQPWEGNVRFRALAPDAFVAFDQPGFVKLVTVIAVEPLGPDESTFRIATGVATTDASARARFRRYWAVFSPGILLIRHAALREVRREVERRQPETRRAGMPGRQLRGADRLLEATKPRIGT
jgi:hypothetical protein